MTTASDRKHALELIDQAREDGARLKSACQELGIGQNTYRRWHQASDDQRPHAERPTPSHALTAQEKATILAVCHQSDYASLPPSQIVPLLLDEHSWYLASESSFYRVLKENNEHHRRGRRTSKRVGPPRRHQATKPNALWCWDVTYLKSPVRGQFYYLYFILDVYSRKIVDGEVFESENVANSQSVLQRALMREQCINNPPVVHSDNGPAMKGGTLPATLEMLGVQASYSRPRVSNDNAYIESLFGTAKQRPQYPPEGFKSLEAAQQWSHTFIEWYNEEHRHSGIRFVTPAQRHKNTDDAVLANRKTVLEKAKAKNPRRWSGPVRNCEPVGSVWLNPDPEMKEQLVKDQCMEA